MKTTVTEDHFRDTIKILRPDNFSDEGLTALFKHLEDYEDSAGEQLGFDPIALCCEFNEDKLTNVLFDYSLKSLEELEENTTVIKVDDETIIYVAF